VDNGVRFFPLRYRYLEHCRYLKCGWVMSGQKIVIASDHAGFDFKASIKDRLAGEGYEVIDLGTHGPESVDYPDYAAALAGAIREGRAERGVLICGTGIGISIAANRHPGIRAALCHDTTGARLSRQHNDANVLVLGARVTGIETAQDCLAAFLSTPFEGGRHSRRVDKMG
jgi:ribose 5-phosphate isomerase B